MAGVVTDLKFSGHLEPCLAEFYRRLDGGGPDFDNRHVFSSIPDFFPAIDDASWDLTPFDAPEK